MVSVNPMKMTTVPNKMNIETVKCEKHGRTGFAIDSCAVTMALGTRVPTDSTGASTFHPPESSTGGGIGILFKYASSRREDGFSAIVSGIWTICVITLQHGWVRREASRADKKRNPRVIHREKPVTHGHHDFVVDIQNSILVKFGRKRVHHRPVGLIDSHDIRKSETEGKGMFP